MTIEQINKLISDGSFPEGSVTRNLVETHISWVIICDQFVYKIKKPKKYSFLDFSTLQKRKYYCEREIELNRRFSNNIYLESVAIRSRNSHMIVGKGKGEIIDYGVKMRKLSPSMQMNLLLQNNKVGSEDILRLAKKIADFHWKAQVIYQKDIYSIQKEFNDLATIKTFLIYDLNTEQTEIIDRALSFSNNFIRDNSDFLNSRIKAGFFRDCHGDLHSRNIFLLPEPQPFDCIEFNDDLRQIDILNEIAFLCMDLDFFGRDDLSGLFLKHYTNLSGLVDLQRDESLFNYYKLYRANVRAKVNGLRAKDADTEDKKRAAMLELGRYLQMMNNYLLTMTRLP